MVCLPLAHKGMDAMVRSSLSWSKRKSAYMKHLLCAAVLVLCFACNNTRPIRQPIQASYEPEPPITQSLFTDKTSTISEEDIQKILDGAYALPEKLRVSLVKLKGTQDRQNSYWIDEAYLQSQQEYLDLFTAKFKQSERVKRVLNIPALLVSNNPTFTTIREAAVRTQSDMVAIYTIDSDLYAKYKLFARSDIKAFATTQLIMLDVRTGLIPFSTVVTKEYQSNRQESELNDEEAASRIKHEAVILTIQEIGEQITQFLQAE